jgi:hypothetical protein
MSSAFNLFVRQALQQHGVPLALPEQNQNDKPKPVRPKPQLGCLKGKIWMSDDFDEPLEDFKEYM